ncbi:PTS sugar transporter subunit IIA [Aerococcus christensenii]|uniref:PTS system fructose IIA component n=1 Tax=Aerococcus christensenii TaxID=87541 RepID=A0A133Y5M6_9LACT|nr:PTS N-acetylglucosamine transporter subunit IIBC [Aerococcus christensenii]KXB38521.1 PTS system fructose IIA component [Aerococcus christensenii]MDK8234321.1 PTS N-acetylglucosamine transporter subunit IIBC [Aerococcus christensenii]
MTKIIIASHHSLAEGFKSTLEYIAPGVANIVTLNAYLDNVSIEDQVKAIMNELKEDEETIIFTDLLGGSVNQEFTKYLPYKKFHLITGANFPVILSLVLKAQNETLADQVIEETIEEAKKQIIYVNKIFNIHEVDEEDE